MGLPGLLSRSSCNKAGPLLMDLHPLQSGISHIAWEPLKAEPRMQTAASHLWHFDLGWGSKNLQVVSMMLWCIKVHIYHCPLVDEQGCEASQCGWCCVDVGVSSHWFCRALSLHRAETPQFMSCGKITLIYSYINQVRWHMPYSQLLGCGVRKLRSPKLFKQWICAAVVYFYNVTQHIGGWHDPSLSSHLFLLWCLWRVYPYSFGLWVF